MKRFKLPEHVKARVINGYQFKEDGTLDVANDADADKMATILVRFHSCTLTDVKPVEAEKPKTTLAAADTKPATK